MAGIHLAGEAPERLLVEHLSGPSPGYRVRVAGEIDPGAIRISDLDRELAARHLGTAMEDGRISPLEYSERCAAAYAARTRSELLEVLADLAGGPPAALGPLELDVSFGQVRRTGQWPVPELVRIVGLGQRTALDLTEAHLERPEVTIEVTATMSATVVLLPAHAQVDTDGLELVAGSVRHRELSVRRHQRQRERWADPTASPADGARYRGGLLRRRAGREEPPPMRVVFRGRAVFSSVSIWQARPGRR